MCKHSCDVPFSSLTHVCTYRHRSQYFHKHLFMPWTHLSVYAIGVGAGIVCSNRDKGSSDGPYGRIVIRLVGWAVVGAISAIMIFANHDWVMGKLPDPVTSGIYDGFHRIVWSIAHCVMIYMIVADHQVPGSLTNKILGNKYLLTLGRLSLSAFVIHPIIQLLFFATQYTQLFSGPIVFVSFLFDQLVCFCADETLFLPAILLFRKHYAHIRTGSFHGTVFRTAFWFNS